VPGQLHAASFTVQSATGSTLQLAPAGTSHAAVCKGDAGGPVVRGSGGTLSLVGVLVAATQSGCLGETGTTENATAVRLDAIADWIAAATAAPAAAFGVGYSSGTGVGSFDLGNVRDQAVPFDYEHSGKLDHLLIYRPGNQIAFVVKHNPDNTFSTVWSSFTGLAGFDLANPADEITPYDYDTGRLDHLVLYRPGSGYVVVARHNPDNTLTPIFTGRNGIGGYDLAASADRIVAYDADHTGRAGTLLMIRPGNLLLYLIRPQVADPQSPPGTVPDHGPAVVETGAYPGAAAIEAAQQIRLISGDGQIMLADCATPPVDNIGVLKVRTTEQIGPDGDGLVCFRVLAPTGLLNLEVPAVYEIRGDGQHTGTGHQVTAKVTTDDGTVTSVAVNPSGSTQVGIGASPDNDPTTLVQLKVNGRRPRGQEGDHRSRKVRGSGRCTIG
jgi:hypothetical protein